MELGQQPWSPHPPSPHPLSRVKHAVCPGHVARITRKHVARVKADMFRELYQLAIMAYYKMRLIFKGYNSTHSILTECRVADAIVYVHNQV